MLMIDDSIRYISLRVDYGAVLLLVVHQPLLFCYLYVRCFQQQKVHRTGTRTGTVRRQLEEWVVSCTHVYSYYQHIIIIITSYYLILDYEYEYVLVLLVPDTIVVCPLSVSKNARYHTPLMDLRHPPAPSNTHHPASSIQHTPSSTADRIVSRTLP